MSTEEIDIVIPVFNEKDNITYVLDAFQKQVSSPIRVLIGYDTDEDTTLEVLKDYHTDRFEIIPLKNKGVGALSAVVTGFYYSDAPAVISYMADDDFNAGMLDLMIETFYKGNDVVVASRFIPGGSMTGCRWYKAFLSRSVAFTLRNLARLPVHDPTNAFRLFSRRLLNAVTIESTAGFTYSMELLLKCHRLGWPMAEVPAQWHERSHGKSRFKVLRWSPYYLRWYFYAFSSTYLKFLRK